MMEFEWDPTKDAGNQKKHGISFTDAVRVFDDPYRLEEDSTRIEFAEERGRAIGVIGKFIVTVIYTNRQNRRRIISARRARTDERQRYYQSKTAP